MTTNVVPFRGSRLLARQCLDTLIECGPLNDEQLATLLGAPLLSVRNCLQHLWETDRVEPDPSTPDAWFAQATGGIA